MDRNGTLMTLETGVQVANLVKEMGPVYQIGYEWKGFEQGVLTCIEVTDIPLENAKP